MATYFLTTPIADVTGLATGDIVYLTGDVVTARDQAHKRCLQHWALGVKLPIDFNEKALFHCGPVVKKVDGRWKVVALGPTTSLRMEDSTPTFLEKSGVKLLIGKGGMGFNTQHALERYSAVYCAYPGGAGALAADSVVEVQGVHWLDLGVPEALWHLRVNNLGPLVVTMDSLGRSLYERVAVEVEKNIREIYRQLVL